MQTNNPKDPASIHTLMQQSSFASIVRKAQLLLKIEQFMPDILPEGFAEHCRVMNLKEGTLVMKVTNSAIATQLRYREDRLINKMQAFPELQSILRIQFLVRPQ